MSEKKVTWIRFRSDYKWSGKQQTFQYDPNNSEESANALRGTIIPESNAREEACKFATMQGDDLINIVDVEDESGYYVTVYYWKYTGSY